MCSYKKYESYDQKDALDMFVGFFMDSLENVKNTVLKLENINIF
jgi:hypothetical protein